jgi:hypothetical protein
VEENSRAVNSGRILTSNKAALGGRTCHGIFQVVNDRNTNSDAAQNSQ